MDSPQYSFDQIPLLFQQDGPGYQGQSFLSSFGREDRYFNFEFAHQACIPQHIPPWNQPPMQRFLDDKQRAPVFNPSAQHMVASNAQPVESLPPVASHRCQESPFSSQELSSCSSAQSPGADIEPFTHNTPLTPPLFPTYQTTSFDLLEPQSPCFVSAMGDVQTKIHSRGVTMTEVNAADENTNEWGTDPFDFSSPPMSNTFSSQNSKFHRDVASRQPSVDHEQKHMPSPALSAVVKEEISLHQQHEITLSMTGSYPTPSLRGSEGPDADINVSSTTSGNDEDEDDDNDNDNDHDDADDDDDDDGDDDGDDDEEYQPENKAITLPSVRQTPGNKRHAPKSIEKSPPKRAKVDASARAPSSRPLPPSHSGSKRSLICSDCSHIFKDEVTLQSHVKKQHTRPFICVFRFAGCASTFASKNEWKRHVMSQHLVLYYWLCDIDACAHKKNNLTDPKPSRRSKAARCRTEQAPKLEPIGPPLPDGTIFNRKDLYTQHIRRMHTPVHVEKAAKASKKAKVSALTATDAEWEEQVKFLQTSAIRERCKLPVHMDCPAPHCTQSFSGADAWDQRMEHVARHLERAALRQEEPVVFGGPTDPTLMDWVTHADVAVVRSVRPGIWELNSPLRAASEGRGVGRKREVFQASLSLGATTTSSLAGNSSAVSPAEPSVSIKTEIFVDEGEEDAEGEEE